MARELFTEARRQFPDVQNLKPLSTWLKDVHRRAVANWAPASVAVAFLSVYATALA